LSKKDRIRALALAIIWHGDQILVAEGYDALKDQTFYRPMGGAIEFGEYGRAAVAREFMEEINEAITVRRYLETFENVFTYNGETGHEIVRLYECEFANKAVYERETMQGEDDNKTLFTTRWLSLSYFQQGNAPLYPDGLLELLLSRDDPA
jgi:8-oxo-dGTP pyrophosphatase MutT (NUDIX family)